MIVIEVVSQTPCLSDLLNESLCVDKWTPSKAWVHQTLISGSRPLWWREIPTRRKFKKKEEKRKEGRTMQIRYQTREGSRVN